MAQTGVAVLLDDVRRGHSVMVSKLDALGQRLQERAQQRLAGDTTLLDKHVKELRQNSEQLKALCQRQVEVRGELKTETVQTRFQQELLCQSVNPMDTQTARDLLEELSTFQQLLGLNFEFEGDWLRVAFVYIDANEPLKQYSVSLRLLEDTKFIVGRTQPVDIPYADALQKLNESNDFGAFVRTVRRLFVQTTRS
eukprot:TRINITY_DN5746_c0_g1_i1.p1 TRINITY_DN5746_c0_g1~~TRINITY_DN5746_c0_g1_i1.p1  ORF type:complete len:206 (-),score=36.47 TRINITY_DN5746_c0_g1_i1:71-658(-)